MAGYWFFDGRYFESTDDGYVNGDVVQVTSEVPGTVLALNVDDTQFVEAGQPLLELDPADAKIAEENAEADLARAVRQVRGLFAQGQELRAQIEQREQAERTADDDLQRRGSLIADGAISAEELSHARDAVTTTRANVAAAREQLSQTVAQIDGTTIANHPQVLAAAAAVRNAALALHRTELTSPVSGVIAKRSVQVGQRVAAGTPLLAVVPLENVWVDANFKEVQLERMRDRPAGDGAHRSVRPSGHLSRTSWPASPPAAATPLRCCPRRMPPAIGSRSCSACRCASCWIPTELKAHPLRIGLSTTVRVDLHNTSGPLMSTAVRNVPLPKQASAGDDPSVDALIASIIADNAGPHGARTARSSAATRRARRRAR